MEVSCDIVLVMNLESEMFLTSPVQIIHHLQHIAYTEHLQLQHKNKKITHSCNNGCELSDVDEQHFTMGINMKLYQDTQ